MPNIKSLSLTVISKVKVYKPAIKRDIDVGIININKRNKKLSDLVFNEA